MPVDPAELERALEALRAQAEAARGRAKAGEDELAQLEERRDEVGGRLAIARGEAAAFEQRLKQVAAELEQARSEAALAAFEDAVATRDAVDEALELKVLAVIDGLAEHEEQARVVAEMHSQLSRSGAPVELPAGPPGLLDAWQRLQELVRASLQEQLEDELIEAAVKSPLGRAIDDLPEHLQEAARRRRFSARRRPERGRVRHDS